MTSYLPRVALAILFWLSGLFIAVCVVPDLLMHRLGLWTTVRTASKGACAITFDDGPDPRFTPLILDELKLRGCRATFFVVGKKAADNPELLDRMAREGHEVGIHGWDHRHPWLLDPVTCAAHMRKASDATARYRDAGAKPKYRPCWGFWSLWLIAATWEFERVMWSVPGNDWKRGATPAAVQEAAGRAGDGDIVLLHDGAQYSGVTAQALPAILEALEARGLRQVTVGELER